MSVIEKHSDQATTTALQAVVDYVWSYEACDFYREHWQRHGITTRPEITSLQDFADTIPLLTKADLLRRTDPDQRCYVPHRDIHCLISGSGTSGQAPLFKWHSRYHYGPLNTDMYQRGGRRQLYVWNYHRSSPNATVCAHSTGIETVMVDPRQLNELEAIWKAYKPDSLQSTPSLLITLHQYLTTPSLARDIQYLVLTGEMFGDTDEQLLRELYPNAVHYNLYALSEAGSDVFVRSPDCTGPVRAGHVVDSTIHVEIVENEIIGTTLMTPHALPLIRYATGDSGSWLHDTCPCGNTAPRVHLDGRTNVDMVRVQGTEIRIDALESALMPLGKDLEPIIRATVSEQIKGNGKQAQLHLHLVQKAHSTETSATLEEWVQRAIGPLRIAPQLTLAEAIANDLFAPTLVSIRPPNQSSPNLKNKGIRLVTDDLSTTI